MPLSSESFFPDPPPQPSENPTDLSSARSSSDELQTTVDEATSPGSPSSANPQRHEWDSPPGNEAMFLALANYVPQIMWTNDGHGVANYFNYRWFEYTGLTLEKSTGLGWQAVVHPDDALAAIDRWSRSLADGNAFATEFRLRRADGHYRWFIGRNVPMRDADGKVEGWFGSATDVHDLKQTQALAHEREEQFRRAIEQAPIPIIMHAEDGQVLQISRTWTELTGYTLEEMPTLDAWLTRAYGFGADAVRDHMRKLFASNQPHQAEYEIRTRTGELRFWVFRTSTPGFLPDGRRFAVGMALDVTERKQTEQELAASQEQLRLIVDSAYEHAIFSMDLDRRVTRWNAGAERISGFDRSEMVGKSGDVIFTEADRAAGIPVKEAEKALATGRAQDERWHLRKDGTLFWGSGAMLPMHAGPGGAVIGFVKVFRDETEKREAREALEASREKLWAALQDAETARREAEAAGRAKDNFLAVLSHELRTPLTPVTMAVQMLLRRDDLPDDVKEAAAMIRTNVQLQANLIDDLLDVTRIARGKMEITHVPADLHAIIQQAVDVTLPDVQAKKQHLTLSLKARRFFLLGDPMRLKQSVWNLLKNASKFTPERGKIQVETTNRDDELVLQVSDTGIGIEESALESIFDPFSQANVSIMREFGGLGLGLSIAKAAVHAHGGELKAFSAGKGRGATFVAVFPLPSER